MRLRRVNTKVKTPAWFNRRAPAMLRELAKRLHAGRKGYAHRSARVRFRGLTAELRLGRQVFFMRYDPNTGIVFSNSDSFLRITKPLNGIPATTVFW